MRQSRAATGILLIFVWAAAVPSALAQGKETERVERTVPIAAGGTLKLNNFSGRVTITGEQRQDVHIVAVRTARKDRLANILLDIQSDGRDVSIEANKRREGWNEDNDNVVETTFDIKVPASANLDVNVFSSPVEITGVTGRHRVHAFSADLRLNGVSGPIDAETFSGGIYLSPAAWQENQSVKVKTFSGDIEMRLPEGASGRLDFESFSGDVDSEVPLTFKSKSKRKLSAEFNMAAAGKSPGAVTVNTFSGDVRLRK